LETTALNDHILATVAGLAGTVDELSEKQDSLEDDAICYLLLGRRDRS